MITVAILNKGKATTKNINLEEEVPSGTSVSYVEGADKVGNLLNWNGELNAGEPHSVTHTLIIHEEKDIIIPVTVNYEDASGNKKKTSAEIIIPVLTEEPTPPFSTIPWLYIIILVAVVLGGIAILIAVRRKEDGAEVTIEENTK